MKIIRDTSVYVCVHVHSCAYACVHICVYWPASLLASSPISWLANLVHDVVCMRICVYAILIGYASDACMCLPVCVYAHMCVFVCMRVCMVMPAFTFPLRWKGERDVISVE